MARGFKGGVYTLDNGDFRNVRVEADRFADAAFAWDPITPPALLQGYIGVRPRHVLGVEASSGRRAKAIVPNTTADVWIGVVTSFVTKDDDGVEHTYVITGYVAEARTLLKA